jgi:hypothetical protein
MQTGCQGPFCHGTGGFCGCNCKCCPPPCCPVVAVYFDCGASQSSTNPGGCTFTPKTEAWANLQLETPTLEVPMFSNKPILSKDSAFIYGASVTNCSVPCETICVQLSCGGNNMPCCCLEICDGKVLSVGNGYVTAPTTVEIPGCLTGTVLLNGQPPPVFVCDCQEVCVSIVTENNCCMCQQVDVKCSLCPTSLKPLLRHKPIWKRKIDSRTGKTKINSTTGLPMIVIDKKELSRRIATRIKQSRRRRK